MTVSDELLALQEADALIREHRQDLYVGFGMTRYLPSDATTKAAFSALCGASRYIERLTLEHVTGTPIERKTNKNEDVSPLEIRS